MANINVVIDEVAKLNPDLARQIQKYVKTHSYGLVYENNLPEAVRLYKKNPTVGDTVNILPERGKQETEENKDDIEESIEEDEEDSYDDKDDDDYNDDSNEELKDLVVIDEEELELEQ